MAVEQAVKFRRAIHEYDQSKKITDHDLKLILDAGRLAPSGIGLEPTQVIVLRNSEIKEKIVKETFAELNWKKGITADSLLLFVSKKGDTFKSKEFIASRLKRWNMPPEELNARVEGYAAYLNSLDADVYSANQAFISMAYVSLQVADLGISSIIMQGFDSNKLNQLLNDKGYIDGKTEAVHITIAIGYPTVETQQNLHSQFRISLDEYANII